MRVVPLRALCRGSARCSPDLRHAMRRLRLARGWLAASTTPGLARCEPSSGSRCPCLAWRPGCCTVPLQFSPLPLRRQWSASALSPWAMRTLLCFGLVWFASGVLLFCLRCPTFAGRRDAASARRPRRQGRGRFAANYAGDPGVFVRVRHGRCPACSMARFLPTRREGSDRDASKKNLSTESRESRYSRCRTKRPFKFAV